MTTNIKKFAVAAVVSVAFASTPAFAEGDSSSGGSDAGGLSSSYSSSMPPAASPTCCKKYYDHGHADENGVRIMTNFNQKISAMQLAIIEALRLSTGQLSGNNREQTGAQHTLADQQDDRATVKEIERTRMDAMEEAASGTASCSLITGTVSGTTAAVAAEIQKQVAAGLNKWTQGDPALPSSLGQDQAIIARLNAHCGKFANAASVESGLCPALGDIPGGDVSAAESIFFQKTNATYSLDEDRLEAANAFIITAVSPAPKTMASDADVNTPQGKIRASLRNTNTARLSVAEETLSYITAQWTPVDNQETISWAQSTAEKITGMGNADYSEGVSEKDKLRLYSQQFLLDPEFLTKADVTAVTAAKDTKNIAAVLAYQGFENYKLLEQIAANLALQTAILTESSPLSSLRTQ